MTEPLQVHATQNTKCSNTGNPTPKKVGFKNDTTYRYPFPADNALRRNKAVATDSVKASVPAIDTGGVKQAQFYIGRASHVADAFRTPSEKEFVNALEDVTQRHGAMDLLISDNAKSEASGRADNVLRAHKSRTGKVNLTFNIRTLPSGDVAISKQGLLLLWMPVELMRMNGC